MGNKKLKSKIANQEIIIKKHRKIEKIIDMLVYSKITEKQAIDRIIEIIYGV